MAHVGEAVGDVELRHAGPVDARRLPGGHFYTAAVWSELPRYMGL